MLATFSSLAMNYDVAVQVELSELSDEGFPYEIACIGSMSFAQAFHQFVDSCAPTGCIGSFRSCLFWLGIEYRVHAALSVFLV